MKNQRLRWILTGALLCVLSGIQPLSALAAPAVSDSQEKAEELPAVLDGQEDEQAGDAAEEFENFRLLEEPVAVQSYEGAGSQIDVYGSFTQVQNAGEEQTLLEDSRLLLKRGKMIPVSAGLNFLDGRIDQLVVDSLTDSRGETQYLSILGEEHYVVDYYEKLKWPEELSNAGIVEISNTLNTNDTILVVRYMDNTVAAFNYLTGSLVFLDDSEKQEISFSDYMGNWFTETWNGLFGKPAKGYGELKLLEAELKLNPLSEASLGTLLGAGNNLPQEGQGRTDETWGNTATDNDTENPDTDEEWMSGASDGKAFAGEAVEAKGEPGSEALGSEAEGAAEGEPGSEALGSEAEGAAEGEPGSAGTEDPGAEEFGAGEAVGAEEPGAGEAVGAEVPGAGEAVEAEGATGATAAENAAEGEPGSEETVEAEEPGAGEAVEAEVSGSEAEGAVRAKAAAEPYLTVYDPVTETYSLYTTKEYLAQSTNGGVLYSENEKIQMMKSGGYSVEAGTGMGPDTGVTGGFKYVIVIFAGILILLGFLLIIRYRLEKNITDDNQ